MHYTRASFDVGGSAALAPQDTDPLDLGPLYKPDNLRLGAARHGTVWDIQALILDYNIIEGTVLFPTGGSNFNFWSLDVITTIFADGINIYKNIRSYPYQQWHNSVFRWVPPTTKDTIKDSVSPSAAATQPATDYTATVELAVTNPSRLSVDIVAVQVTGTIHMHYAVQKGSP